MCKLFIVTYIDFWRHGAGHRTRLASLIHYFKTKVTITVVYAGTFNDEDDRIVRMQYPEIRIDPLERNRKLTYKEYGERFEAYIQEKTIDFLLVEYIELAFVLPLVWNNVVTLLDTNDVISDRIASFSNYNLPYQGIELTETEEIQIFNCFDYVIAIQQTDYTKLVNIMGEERVILTPHGVQFQQKKLRNTVERIGFVASEYTPNVDALQWFLSHVWPSVNEKYNVTFEIYGGVCKGLPGALLNEVKGIRIHGFRPDIDEIYESCDVMVNPVRCGAGLKIKNVEALGHGLPLVTTSHGSLGMEDGCNNAFLVADTAADFILCLEKLMKDHSFRYELGKRAYDFAKHHFSVDKCYQSLELVMLGTARMV